MKKVIVTQRVDVFPDRGERRDALDQRWPAFLFRCGLIAVPVPNHPEHASRLFDDSIGGLILTGGNDLENYGGDAPERDATERHLLDIARKRGIPVLGVCRGMLLLLDQAGMALSRVEGHVATMHALRVDGTSRKVNSYHHMAAFDAGIQMRVTARADDGVIEAFVDETEPRAGIMWHPERCAPFDSSDILFVQRLFGASPP